jgi:hypothetical protein
MFRKSLLLLTPLLLLAGAARAQSPGLEDPYKVYIPPAGPYWGYWGSPVADTIRAQGEFLIDIQRVNLMQQQLKREKLVTRKLELEHWAWERKFIPRAFEEQKELSHDMEIRRLVRDARPAEIYSAAALNTFLKELFQISDQLSKGDSTPVEQEWLAHVHVNSGLGNSGLLKADKIAWPLLVLGRPDLADDRTEIEHLLADAKTAVVARNETPAADLIALRRKVDHLEGRLKGEVRQGGYEDWRPGQYVAALRSLNELKDSLALLEQPDAATYLNPLKGRTVFELVSYMKNNGLTFAPATRGDERFYSALYYALRDELKRAGGVPEPKEP